MEKSRLKRRLSRLKGFDSPKVSLEQYVTPPELAADLLHSAYMQQDLESCTVIDLGTGTGILAIGAALAGAGTVHAVDRDPEVLETARSNARDAGVEDDIDFREEDVSRVSGDYDTCVMNPPFSVHSDTGLDFVEKAFEAAAAVYMVAPVTARERIKDFAENSGYTVRGRESYLVELPPTHGFHTEESRKIEVDLVVAKTL